jgi:type II secretion system protein N
VTATTRKKVLHALGYLVFFGACFVVSLLVTFPYDRLTGYAERELESSMGREVTIEKLRPTVTLGVRADGVTIGPAIKAAPGQEPGGPLVRIDRAVVGVSWLGLVFGSTSVSFDLDVAGGSASGSFERDDEHVALDLDLEGVQAKQLQIIQDKVGLPVQGSIEGHIEFDVPVGHAEKSVGDIDLGLQGVIIGDGKARLSLSSLMGYGRGRPSSDEGTVIQPIKIGPIALQTKLVDGTADIPRVEAVSEHAEITFEGRIKLLEPLAQSRVDTYLTVKLNAAYAEQDEQTEALVSLADTAGGRAKRPDGSFGFRISGALGSGLSFRGTSTFSLPGSPESPRAGGRPAPGRWQPPRSPRTRLPSGEEPDEGPSIEHPAATPVGGPIAAPPPRPSELLYPSGMPRPQPTTAPDEQQNENQYPDEQQPPQYQQGPQYQQDQQDQQGNQNEQQAEEVEEE